MVKNIKYLISTVFLLFVSSSKANLFIDISNDVVAEAKIKPAQKENIILFNFKANRSVECFVQGLPISDTDGESIQVTMKDILTVHLSVEENKVTLKSIGIPQSLVSAVQVRIPLVSNNSSNVANLRVSCDSKKYEPLPDDPAVNDLKMKNTVMENMLKMLSDQNYEPTDFQIRIKERTIEGIENDGNFWSSLLNAHGTYKNAAIFDKAASLNRNIERARKALEAKKAKNKASQVQPSKKEDKK